MQDIVDLYTRVSLDMQAEEGHSLQEQEYRLQRYAEAQGWKVHAVRSDPGRSGASLDRPGIQQVIEDVKAGRVNRVVVYKLDRLSRSQKDTLYLIEDVFLSNHVDFVSLTESLDTSTPLGMAMIGILSVFAQLERQQIAERMMMGRIASAREGNWRGGSGVPIGYRYIPRTATEPGQLVVDPYEADIVRKVFELFLAGKTYHAIMRELQEAGYRTKYGAFAGGGSALIPAMLSNRAYIGDIRYRQEWYPGRHEPIIDEDTFQRVQDKMAEYKATLDDNRRQPFAAKRQLTGLLYCAECGARWSHTFSKYHTATGEYRRYEFYRCYTRAGHKRMASGTGCTMEPWRAQELEALVWDQVEALTFEEAQQAPQEDPTAPMRAKLDDLDKQLDRLVRLYALGSVPFDVIQKRSEELSEERANLSKAIDAARRKSGRLTRHEAEQALATAAEIRASDDEAAKRELLTLLIKRITVGRDEVRIEWNI